MKQYDKYYMNFIFFPHLLEDKYFSKLSFCIPGCCFHHPEKPQSITSCSISCDYLSKKNYDHK